MGEFLLRSLIFVWVRLVQKSNTIELLHSILFDCRSIVRFISIEFDYRTVRSVTLSLPNIGPKLRHKHNKCKYKRSLCAGSDRLSISINVNKNQNARFCYSYLMVLLIPMLIFMSRPSSPAHTLLTLKAAAKRSQHANITLGVACCVRLATVLRHVECCWLKFDHFQTRAYNSLNPTMLRYVALACFDRLAGLYMVRLAPQLRGEALKCHYDQILNTQFLHFRTQKIFPRYLAWQISIYHEHKNSCFLNL